MGLLFPREKLRHRDSVENGRVEADADGQREPGLRPRMRKPYTRSCQKMLTGFLLAGLDAAIWYRIDCANASTSFEEHDGLSEMDLIAELESGAAAVAMDFLAHAVADDPGGAA